LKCVDNENEISKNGFMQYLDEEGQVHVLGDGVLPVSIGLMLLGNGVNTLHRTKIRLKQIFQKNYL
jgi:hypothetical protein